MCGRHVEDCVVRDRIRLHSREALSPLGQEALDAYDDMASFTDPSVTGFAIDHGQQLWIIHHLFTVDKNPIGGLTRVFDCGQL